MWCWLCCVACSLFNIAYVDCVPLTSQQVSLENGGYDVTGAMIMGCKNNKSQSFCCSDGINVIENGMNNSYSQENGTNQLSDNPSSDFFYDNSIFANIQDMINKNIDCAYIIDELLSDSYYNCRISDQSVCCIVCYCIKKMKHQCIQPLFKDRFNIFFDFFDSGEYPFAEIDEHGKLYITKTYDMMVEKVGKT